MRKGISRRWLINTIGVIAVILIVFITVLSITIQSSTYNGIQQTLVGRSDELLNALSSGTGGYKTPSEFTSISRVYIENFPDKNSMEIMSLNRNGRVVITSTGFAPNESSAMPDYISAISNPDNSGNWVGKMDTGEKVMAVTRVVRDPFGSPVGSIRYVVSLEKADRQITFIILTLVLVGVFVMLVITISGLYFLRSILDPIHQISLTAKQISQGDFDVRVERSKDDEIGLLCDSINDMAVGLGASERMKNDFISSVSHELRTPLTSIKGWAETLHSGGIDTTTNEKGMNVIIRESERLTGIVEELLDFSRIQSGGMKLNITKIDIFSELDEAVYMFTDRANTEEKNLNYTENTTITPLFGDINRLRQVFVNIIDNALKYTEKGGNISVASGESNGYINVIITDTGCGIPAEHLPNIKNKFYKANQLVRGSGIGLAVANEIVLLHSGKLEIESEVGVGTSVTITLPTMKTLLENPTLSTTSEMQKIAERTKEINE